MTDIYKSGEYLETTQSWHAEDSAWKADQILRIIHRNDFHPSTIAEIGCGAGVILDELSKQNYLDNVQFTGYDISPQAIALCEQVGNERIRFVCADMFSETNFDRADLLLVIDVIEHVPDYMGFLEKCKGKAEFKIFHIPLDIHVSSVMRNAFISGRYTLGHLHYFTADSATAVLQDSGYEIVDYFYTDGAFGLFQLHPSFKRAIANVPRLVFSKFNLALTARVFGGYSLLVLAK